MVDRKNLRPEDAVEVEDLFKYSYRKNAWSCEPTVKPRMEVYQRENNDV